MILFIKTFLVVPIGRHCTHLMHQFDIVPCKVNLMRPETATRAFGKKVVIIVPFSSYNSGPELIDRFIIYTEIYSFTLFVFPLSVPSIVKGPHTYRPKPCGTKEAGGQRISSDKVKCKIPE